MRVLPILLAFGILVTSVLLVGVPHGFPQDPCDSYGDCISSSISYIRANPDGSLFLGDSFRVLLYVTTGQNATGYSVSWSYDSTVFARSGETFTVAGNESGTFSIGASVTFAGPNTTLATAQSVTIIHPVISLTTRLVNVTGSRGLVYRNADGSFYHNDSFCVSWSATFPFASARIDVKINVTSVPSPAIRALNYTADPLGRTGEFCYVIETGSAYRPYNATLVARALNWQGTSLALKDGSQPFAVVRYDPQFTTYAYMEFRNSTAASSLERPWVLFVKYDGNDPGYAYAGDSNTAPFNGSANLLERAYFDNFTYSSLSYQPLESGGVFLFHVTNSTGALEYGWINENGSAQLQGGNRIEKYVFDATPSTLAPLLSEGYVYQNITMNGCWSHEGGCYLKQYYWLVPFLWSGRVNKVAVGSDGNVTPTTPLSVTIHNPSPLDQWLVGGFEHVFGDDPQAVRSFEADLYPTNQTMTFNGTGELNLLLNQTSLVPPQISITAGDATTSGNFTFVPVFVNSAAMSVPNSFNGTIFYANATIPLWSYNMIQGQLAFLPLSTTIDQPTTFLELVNSSGWVAGSTTAPQTPVAFASQEYGFWPMGENLTVYVNLQGGGVNLLGVQKIDPSEDQASFYIEPWSGGMSSVQLVEGGRVMENESTLNASAYPSPLPQGVTGLYSVSYPATGQDVKAVFTNVWGAKTTIDLGVTTPPPPVMNLIPETTIAAFGIAGLALLIVSGVLRTRKTNFRQ